MKPARGARQAGTPVSTRMPAVGDGDDAARYAAEAGELLLELRERAASDEWKRGSLGDAGDVLANRRLLELLPRGPRTATACSRRSRSTTRVASRPIGSGSSTRSTAPASSPSRGAPTGRCTSRCGPGATVSSPVPWHCPRRDGCSRPRPRRRHRWPRTGHRASSSAAPVHPRPRIASRRRSPASSSGWDRPARRPWRSSPATSTRTCTRAVSTSGTRPRPRRWPLAAGLHVSRIDGSPLEYNRRDPWLPDLIVCRRELAEEVLAAVAA